MRRPRAVALSVVVVLAAACASTVAKEADCRHADPSMLRVLQQRITVDGTLRNGAVRTEASNDITFVTAELHKAGDRDNKAGNLLTWSIDSPSSQDFRSVDVRARDDSSWPKAAYDVRHKGASESRACAALWVGDTTTTKPRG